MRPIVLAILDGWGYSKQQVGNAIVSAGTPTLDEIAARYPSTLLQASGLAVGMTFGETGNSEVGHMTLGAGRIISQYLTRINKAIETDEFFANKTLLDAARHVQSHQGTLHIAGLLTSGAVHAYLGHLEALIRFARQQKIDFKLHLFTDGRDSGLKEGATLLKKLSDAVGGLAELSTIIGRDFAMDRNNNWDRTEAAYKLIADGTGTAATDPVAALEEYYRQNINDPDIPATVIKPTPMKDGDAIIFFNFREDSMRQLARVFLEPGFDIFLKKVPENLYVAAMTRYLETLPGQPELHVVMPPPEIKNGLIEVLADNGKKHLHIAETEKYAHVTFFFNGLKAKPFPGETDFFIDSYEDLLAKPEMRAKDIADKVITELERNFYDFFVVNFANGDLLAHLGVLEAAERGVKAVDNALAALKESVLAKDGILIITADHGNAESMVYKSTGERETRHNDNPVPFHLVAKEYEKDQASSDDAWSQGATGLLADVAPTILELMGLPKPLEMTGDSLLGDLTSSS
ncbi:MAG TPA: 2,3-bisphosphoglycerate-independent phosphoglycerate mutase [Candidatus Paceibacterota bacterium]|nr:2,3-bisphosphoglycerate-independent phosphoglycerate mutase [Candidatus Paceibacterota bacterium]